MSHLRQPWLCLLLLATCVWGRDKVKPCHPRVQRRADECSTFTIDNDCEWLTYTEDRFKVRSVYYLPRPVGEDVVDVYGDAYTALHRRDLRIIKQVLKANTIRLGPFPVTNKGSHDRFVRLCREEQIFLIPTFDLDFFFTDPVMKHQSWDRRIKEMETKFTDFLEHLSKAPVLFWSVNHGLFLNQTVASGQYSVNNPDATRSEYFLFVQVIRKIHHRHEWDEAKARYRRPLALPLLLDSYNQIGEIGWYMKFAEGIWDRWSKSQTGDKNDPPEKYGSFDVWIAETAALPKDEVVRAMESIHMYDEYDDECDSDEGVETSCYNTKKAVVLQFGFSVLYPGVVYSSRVIKPQHQQDFLKDVWKKVVSPKAEEGHCMQGGIVDEWVDDWDRCRRLGYETSGYMHTQGGMCAQVKLSVGETYLEWFGLNGQYSSLFHHCIDPRYMDKKGFRFRPEQDGDTEGELEVWKQVPLCQMKLPSRFAVTSIMIYAATFVLIVVWRCTKIRGQERVREQSSNEEIEQEEKEAGGAAGAAAEAGPSHRQTVVNNVLQESVQMKVPPFLNDAGSFTFALEVKKGHKAYKYTKDQLRFILAAHTNAQARRLQHQVESEAYAVQDKSRQGRASGKLDELDLCYDQATRNVHSRALEGYVTWLVDQAKTKREYYDAKQEMLDNSRRKPWELWVEALLLRTLESLSEQLLHSPEMVSAIYHRVRLPDGEPWSREQPVFTIDYMLLHQGIEKLKEQPNPYAGGVNFDDLNDCGRLNEPELTPKKTYQESVGILVVIDIISNFLPVICVKVWLFLLAWYVHLVGQTYLTSDARNGTFIRPAFLAGNAVQVFAFSDAIAGFAIETTILLHGFWQGRLSWLGKYQWMLRHTSNLVVTGIGAGYLWTLIDVKTIDMRWKQEEAEDPRNRPSARALYMCFCYWVVRVTVFTVLHRKWTTSSSYIEGTPRERRNPQVHGTQGSDSAPSEEAAAEEGDGGGLALEEHYEAAVSWKVRSGRRLIWCCMLGGCFFFEVFFIAPLAAGFDHDAFCEIQCRTRSSRYWPGVPDALNVGNDCWACRGTLLLTWTLVGLTALFDVYYMFYFGTAVVGYAMGEARGLRNVLSTALRYIDFNTRGTSKRALSDLRMLTSDGEMMCRVFGTSWRILWSRLVESLYEECLITANERDNIVRAAGTTTWAKRKDKENFKPSDTFEYLKFVATATRGANRIVGADVGHERTKCISGLCIRERADGEVQVLEVPATDHVTQEVFLSSREDCEKVQTALLTDNKDNPDQSILELISAVEVNSKGEKVTLKEKWRLVATPDSALSGGTSEEEVLLLLKQLESFPAKVVFKTTAKYGECVLKLAKPCRVHSVSFVKTHDNAAMDPVQWRVEGLQPAPQGSEEKAPSPWKQLVWQDSTLEPRSHGRGEPIDDWFEVECWRQKMRSPDSVDLNTFEPAVAERLGFFSASLKGILNSNTMPLRHGIDSLMDSHVGNLPSLSQIIPVYGETIILDEKTLCQSDGVSTNLGFIISQFDAEWERLSRKLNKEPDTLYHSFVTGMLRDAANSEDRNNLAKAKEASELIMEVRLWASMRSQTVARTVVGAIKYHEILMLLPSIREIVPQAQDEQEEVASREDLEKCVELILAHQTYGQKRKDDKPGLADSDKDVQYLLRKYSDKPFYLVLDYNEKTAEAGLTQKVRSFLHTTFQYSGKVQYASVLARWRQISGSLYTDEDGLEIVDVLPRRNPLLVGEGDFRTQGKAGNQLGALRFARGHYLQMMDSNMGAFLGEVCKVPFVLRRFCPHNFNRASVTARIIGFREFIFTEEHGTVGNIMASAEFSFGTICQRFLAGLGARMHYGHPDFLDGFWASNRGSLSKASPSINLSEDIFAGFNVAMRNEESRHVDSLAWEKGREVSFNSSSLFFSKVSGGNAGVMRSRDLKIISENLSITDNFSFFFASIGFYLNNLLIDHSVMLYVLLFVLLALSAKTLEEVGDSYSMLATEWVLSLGIVAMFPRFMELTLEYGPLEGILRFVPSVPGSMAMFTFINKSIASAVGETMLSGKAQYISTGRPNANTHYGWRECYFIFCKTHYYPALNVCFCYVIYFLLARKMNLDCLPMMVLMVSVLLWIIAPILFCPQPTLQTLTKDLSQFWQFCIATPPWSVRKVPLSDKNTEDMLHTQMGNPRSTLYEFWLAEELKSKQAPIALRFCQMFMAWLKFFCLLLVVHTSMLDHMFTMVGIFIVQLLLTEVWRLLYRPTALILVIMISGIALPLAWFKIPLLDYLLVFMTFNFGLKSLHDFVLLCATFIWKPDNSWTKWDTSSEELRARRRKKQRDTRSYDIIVEYFYVSFQQHLQHTYKSVLILLLDLLAQLPLIFLDMLGGIHSVLLLNANLGGSCGWKRGGYEPRRTNDERPQAKGRRRGSSTLAFLSSLRSQPERPETPGAFEMRAMGGVAEPMPLAMRQQLLTSIPSTESNLDQKGSAAASK